MPATRPARPCPAARPTAGRRGRRRRRPACGAAAPRPRGRSTAEDAVAVVLEGGPVARVRGQVVGEAGAGTQHREQPGCAAGPIPAGAPAGPRPGRRRSRAPSSASTRRCSDRSGEVGVAGAGQRGDDRPGLGVGRLVAVEVPQPQRRVGEQPRRPARRPRSRTGPAGRRPGAGSPRSRGSCAQRGGSARGRATRSANRPANGAQASCTSRVRRVRQQRRWSRRSSGLAATPTTSRSAQARTISGSSRCGTAGRRPCRPTRNAWCGVHRAAGQQRRAGRQLGDLVVVQLQHVGRERQRGEERIGVGGVALGDEQRAHLRAVDARAHAATTDLGEQLGAEADGQRREVGRQRLREQPADADQLGARRVVVQRRLRAAQDDQPVVLVETVGQRVAVAQVPLVEGHAGVAEPLAQPGRRIGRGRTTTTSRRFTRRD